MAGHLRRPARNDRYTTGGDGGDGGDGDGGAGGAGDGEWTRGKEDDGHASKKDEWGDAAKRMMNTWQRGG